MEPGQDVAGVTADRANAAKAEGPDAADEVEEGPNSEENSEPFKVAVAKITAIVGADHVSVTMDERQAISRDTSPWRRLCSAVVSPRSAEEVAAVVRIADQYRLSLWPFGRGKNWGNGAAQGVRVGEVILMLDRLDQIIEVNERLAYAVIEPGVSQLQLNTYLKDNGIKLWMDCTDSTPNASVIGNALERGVGYGPYSDHFGNLCGLEVVMPNGDMMRTGGGAANSTTWNTFKWGTGPFMEGLFAQSNFGVVTKAGVWLMPEPEAFTAFLLEAPDDEGLFAAIEVLRRLSLQRVIHGNFHVVNDLLLIANLIQYPYEMLDGRSFLSQDAMAQLRERYKVARWTVVGGLYGTRLEVKLAQAEVYKALHGFGRVTFLDKTRIGVVNSLVRHQPTIRRIPGLSALLTRALSASPEMLALVPQFYDILRGVPSEYIVSFAYFKSPGARPRTNVDPIRDRCGFRWMALMSQMTGDDMRRLVGIVRPIYESHGFDFGVSLIMVNPRTILFLMPVWFDWNKPEETGKVEPLQDAVMAAGIAAGYQPYRINVAFSDRVLATNAPFQRVADCLKSAVDPNDIIAPGRYGVGLSNQPTLAEGVRPVGTPE